MSPPPKPLTREETLAVDTLCGPALAGLATVWAEAGEVISVKLAARSARSPMIETRLVSGVVIWMQVPFDEKTSEHARHRGGCPLRRSVPNRPVTRCGDSTTDRPRVTGVTLPPSSSCRQEITHLIYS